MSFQNAHTVYQKLYLFQECKSRPKRHARSAAYVNRSGKNERDTCCLHRMCRTSHSQNNHSVNPSPVFLRQSHNYFMHDEPPPGYSYP